MYESRHAHLAGHGLSAQMKARVPATTRVRLRTALFRAPQLARLIAHTDRRTRLNLITPVTQLVIDGFHRSANTYAVVSFERANPAVMVSHHLHSPLSVHEARRHGTPMILLIRSPRDAAASYLQFESRATPLAALQMYAAYYRTALPFLDDVIVSDFPETTSNFAGVVQRCNQRFGTRFAIPEATEEFEEAVRVTIRDGWKDFHGIPLPSETRLGANEALGALTRSESAALAAAEDVYEQVLRHREQQLFDEG